LLSASFQCGCMAPQYWRGHIFNEAALVHRCGFVRPPRAPVNGPDWSLNTERASNIHFPFFVAATGMVSGSRIGAALATIAGIGGRVVLQVWHGAYGIADANSPNSRSEWCCSDGATFLERCRLVSGF
jgi:peptidoglycan/LPS O-acetylase OafA/YrhL